MFSRRLIKRVGIVVLPLLLGAILLPAAVASADPPGMHGHHGNFFNFRPHGQHGFRRGATYDCTGGTIPPGVYDNVSVTGLCYAPIGNVTIRGNVTVAPRALLDAVTKGDPATRTKAVVPATVNIGGNVTVGSGAVFLLGCSPNITCTKPPGITYDHVQGNVTAYGAQGVVIHSASIGGNVTIVGGGGGAAAESCAAQNPTTPTIPTLEPWSEDAGLSYTPVYTDTEDTTVGGNYTVTGLTSCWLGTFRNQIVGNATVSNNTMGDPDAMEIDNNLVNGNMVCFANSPAVQFGDSGSAPNLVGGIGIGQCGFNVTMPNPSTHTTTTVTPPVHITAGIQEHVTVSTRALATSVGTYSSTPVGGLTPVKTSSGDTIAAQLGNFVITGAGLTGSGTFNPTVKPGHSGYAFLATTYPNGTTSFTVYITCHCGYGGQAGTITIRAYGTTSAHGFTSGTFLITSGGAPATVKGDLSTLAGYGTFNNAGEPTGSVRLIEHLAIT